MRPDFPPIVPATIDGVIASIGETGRRLNEIGASEGAAGNISVFLGRRYPRHEEFSIGGRLPTPTVCPELAGCSVLVTGSGRRLREIHLDPFASIAHVEILSGGEEMDVWISPRRLFERPTSEFNTHLAIHKKFAVEDLDRIHAVVHAQPLYLTYLSHVPRYQDQRYMNTHILRWQPESIVQLPEGVGVLPFVLPGSPALEQATLEKMRRHPLVLWGKHGVIARSVGSVKKAGDLIEYAETGAHYEYLNLANHGIADGMTAEEIQTVCSAFGREQDYF